MHYDLIIVTKLQLDTTILQGINYCLLTEAKVKENCVNDFSYDYLIIDQIYPELNVLTENGKIITNENLETSMENVFAIGSINNSYKDINEQLQIIIEYLS